MMKNIEAHGIHYAVTADELVWKADRNQCNDRVRLEIWGCPIENNWTVELDGFLVERFAELDEAQQLVARMATTV